MKMRPRWARGGALVGALLAWAVASVALAQTTGGSYGGGDWGSGSHGGGSWSGGGSHGGGGDGGLDLVVFLVRVMLVTVGPIPTLVVVGVGVVGWMFVRSQRHATPLAQHPGGYVGMPAARAAWSKVDITAIRLGIDWRARRGLQQRLLELARTSDTRSKPALLRLLQQTIDAIESTRIAWLYAGVTNFHPMSPPEAQQHFRTLALAARANFENELVRAADGQRIEREAPAMKARAHEGEGVIVVTLIVAARTELVDVPTPDAGRIAAALRALRGLGPDELVALEVVWSPAADDDRMSTLELEARYPGLRKIDEGSIGGRTFCAYCRGPYPAELRQCPHCGAPGTHRPG